MEKINIFDIVKPYNNDMVGSMSKVDRDYYLKYLNQYILELRDCLNLSNITTFGVEVETEHVDIDIYEDYRYDKSFDKWIFEYDCTLERGREVDSPIFKDNCYTWEHLSTILEKLSKCSGIYKNSGGHIHIGAQVIGTNEKYYSNLLKLWAAYENIIFRFGYGEFLTERIDIDNYARSMVYQVNDIFNFDIDILDYFCIRKSNSISYQNIKRDKLKEYVKCIEGHTVEVRSPNGTLNPIIWQNNINFFVKLFLYAKSNKFNEELINERIKRLISKVAISFYETDYYRKIDLEGAIELADLIFDNNLDKVYFLRQYIKNYEVGTKPLEKGTKFTKSLNY